MTKQTVTAMFDRYADAARAVERLEQAGVPHADVSIVSNDASERGRWDTTGHSGDTKHADAGTGAGTGATIGTVLGGGAGLLAGLGLMAIPGLGPVVAAGWLASTLLGAGVGAATGGTIGALTGAGIDETHAHSYAEGIRRGGTLVTARVDPAHVATATDILDDHGTIDMHEREQSWRSEGWTGRYAEGESTAGSTSVPGTLGSTTGTSGGVAPVGTRDLATRGNRVRTYPGV